MPNKTLYLVRHAESDMHRDLTDFDRPLNLRGLQDAPIMGNRLKLRGILPDTLICSPATRAKQTMELLTTAMDFPQACVVLNKSIYEASLNALLYLINELDDAFDSAMLIGHNPAMSWLANELCGKSAVNMPPCSVVTLEIPVEAWSQVGSRTAELLDFDFPKKAI